MTPQLKPERWLCTATAFAMALDVPVAELLSDIGHDGSHIAWPDLPEPACRVGHHIQEIVSVCIHKGFSATPIELFPVSMTASKPPQYHSIGYPEGNWERFTAYIKSSRGVLEGMSWKTGHAYAFDHGRVINPDGGEFIFSREACNARHFTPFRAWRVSRVINDESCQRVGIG